MQTFRYTGLRVSRISIEAIYGQFQGIGRVNRRVDHRKKRFTCLSLTFSGFVDEYDISLTALTFVKETASKKESTSPSNSKGREFKSAFMMV